MADSNAKRTVFINSVFTTFQTVVDKFIFFIINVLISRYLAPALFGEYTTSLAYATFYSTFIDIGIKSTLIRSVSKDSVNKEQHITNAFLLEFILSIIVYTAMALSLFFMNYSTTVVYLILIFGFVRIGNAYMDLFYAIYAAQERFIVQAVNNSLFSLILLISTIIVILLKQSLFAFAYSRLAIISVFISFLAYFTLKEIKLKFRRESLKIFLPQAYHFGLSSIYNNLIQRTNIIILSYMHGTLFSGFFSNAYMIFTTLFFIPNNLNRVLIAHLYRYNYRKSPGKFQFAFDIYSKVFDIISIGISMLLFIFSEEIITFIYGKNYLPAAGILKITALAIPLLFNVSGILLTAIDKQAVVTKCQGYAFIINIIANFILIYRYKGVGAAWATVITFFVLNMFYNIALMQYTKVNYFSSIRIKCLILLIAISVGSLKNIVHLKINFLFLLGALGLLYCMMIYIFIINKRDLNIAREIFGKIIPEKKYIIFG